MPRNTFTPKYRQYKPKNLAVVRIDGKDHYLGPYGSPESWEKYHRLLAERAKAKPAAPPGAVGLSAVPALSINEVVLSYMQHCRAYYDAPERGASSELANIRLALKPLVRLYGRSSAGDFGPGSLKTVRQALIDSGIARTSINARVGRVVRMFRWAVEGEMVPPSVHHALTAVAGLRKGRSGARETEPVRPVDAARVEAIRPFVTPQVWAIVQLQRLTAARSGEICLMRGIDVDRSGAVWIYRPRKHKNAHHGHAREILLGPKAQAVLTGWLRTDEAAYLFQPAEAVEAWKASKRSARKSPLTPSQVARAEASRNRKAARAPGARYDSRSLAHAIGRACKRAEVESWHPHQLRHAAATEIRARFGLEAAQTVLGHAKADVTQVYAERDLARAHEVIREIG